MSQDWSQVRLGRALVVVGLVLLMALTACGRKNPPVLPDGQEDGYPRDYPTTTEPQQGIFN